MIGTGGILHVFCVTSGGGIHQYWGSDETGWNAQDVSDGGVLSGNVAVVYLQGHYDLFGIGLDGALWQHTYSDGSPGWDPWRRLGGSGLVGGLGAARDPNGTFRVVAVTSRGGVRQFTSTNGLSWSSSDITNGGIVTGAASVALRGPRVDVFAIGMDQQVWKETAANGGSYGGWAPVGGTIG